MKKYCLILLGIILLASCSGPKYTYYFDYYDSGANKKKVAPQGSASMEQPAQESVLAIDETTLTASAKENEPHVTLATTENRTKSKEEMTARIKSMSKAERKELKREVKNYVKENKGHKEYGEGARELENDVKLAAIFGAAGLVLLIIGGDILYILGAVALLIGLYFFIRWLINQ